MICSDSSRAARDRSTPGVRDGWVAEDQVGAGWRRSVAHSQAVKHLLTSRCINAPPVPSFRSLAAKVRLLEQCGIQEMAMYNSMQLFRLSNEKVTVQVDSKSLGTMESVAL
jgi:ribosomal protein L32E